MKGRIDIASEVSKISNKIKKASEGVARQRKTLDDPAYQQKVSDELQEVERRKLKDFEAEVQTYQDTLKDLERLRVEE